ncbi:MAG: ATPase, T2SS/T4P/T4SS family, partial [Candidatus Sumerlaeales bacterium]|nr:ATPase, T2SS/T4P/T4SS family [Candidatus Sumerlaeales bacterium]
EMRDLETTEAAITAAETGHLVFGTLHTISASETINRIIDQFPVNQQEQMRAVISVALRTIIAQTLLPRATGRGRVAAYEILHNTPAVANLIRERKTNRIISTMQTSAKQGMVTMDDYLVMLYKQGIITGEICLERAHYPNDMREKLLSLMGESTEGSEDA